MTSLQPEPGPVESRIAVLVVQGHALFESLVAGLGDNAVNRSVVTSHAAKFKLWASSHSLGYRLRDASFIRNHLLSLLQDLCKSLNEGEFDHGLNKADRMY